MKMGNKSKRYFHQDDNRDRGHRHQRSSSPSSSTEQRGQSSKYSGNKQASEKLKQFIFNQSDSKQTTSRSPITGNNLSIEDQIKRADRIAEINTEKFEVKQFTSSRSSRQKVADDSLDLLNIPLPIDFNSWKENPKILINPQVCFGQILILLN